MFVTMDTIRTALDAARLNIEQIKITPAPAPEFVARFPNCERTGAVESLVITTGGDAFYIELCSDRIELWTLDYSEGTAVDYSDCPRDVLDSVSVIFAHLFPDERAALGFSQIEA